MGGGLGFLHPPRNQTVVLIRSGDVMPFAGFIWVIQIKLTVRLYILQFEPSDVWTNLPATAK
jgi:hypothetical protein